MPLVRFGFRLSYLGIVVAVVAATGIAGLLVGLDGNDSQAAFDARESPVDLAAPATRIEPTAVVRAEPTRFTPVIPPELLIPPQNLAPPPTVRPVAALPTPPAHPEVTASIPPVAAGVPLPHKRAGHEARTDRAKLEPAKSDKPRTESAAAQIARIKATLKLTPSQEPYWPPVEAALRDILAQVGYDSAPSRGVRASTQAATSAQIDPARVQRLTSAAMPLIMTFDEAQKREVRRLARIMGLENVASAI